MSTGIGSGDKLARGAVRATYSTTEGGVTQDKWAQAFNDYDAEKFKNEPNKSSVRTEVSGSDASGNPGRDAGTDPGTIESSEPATR